MMVLRASFLGRDVVLIGAILSLGSCGGAPTPGPIDSNSAAVGVQVSMKALGIFGAKPDVVLFARLEAGQDPVDVTSVYVSSFAKDGEACLLNAPPGTYVMVATVDNMNTPPAPIGGAPVMIGKNVSVAFSVDLTSDTTHRNYCSRELMEKTRVEVAPGAFVFMGKFELDRTGGLDHPDDCQSHFLELVEGHHSTASKVFSGNYSHPLKLRNVDNSDGARRAYFEDTEKALGKTGWGAVIDKESR